jgi:hypothetical protein
MKKQILPYLLIAGLLFILMVVSLLRPEPVQWTPTWSAKDKNPFGSYALFEMLPDIFPEKKVHKVTVPMSDYLTEKTDSKANLLLLGDRYVYTSEQTHHILEHIRKGNSAFLAFRQFGALADSVQVETEQMSVFNTDVPITFVNPLLKARNPYKIRGEDADYYFLRNDSAGQDALSLASGSDPVMVRVAIGKGMLYLHTVPLLFTNYYLLRENTAAYISKSLSYLPIHDMYWDEYIHMPAGRPQTPLRVLLSTPSFRAAWYTLLVFLLLYMLFQSKRRQRSIPLIEPLKNTTLEFAASVAGVYRNGNNHSLIARKKSVHFREHLREKYKITEIPTQKEDMERASLRTGVPVHELTELFGLMTALEILDYVNEEQLVKLNRSIESFYKKTNL